MLLFSDIHLDEFKQFSTLKEGMNTRLLDQIYVIKGILELINQRKIKEVVFLGDMINSFGPFLSKTVYNAMAYLIQSISELAEFYIVIGNHDIFRNRHLFYPFEKFPNVHIVNQPSTAYLDGYSIDMVPWGYDIPKKNKSDILMAHLEVKGAIMNAAGIRTTNGIDQTELEDYKYVLLGHYHSRQLFQIPGARWAGYVGSVMQIDLAHLPEKRGVVILDEGRIRMEEIHSPKMYTEQIDSQAAIDRLLPKIETGDYWRLTVTSPDVKVPSFDHRVQVEYNISPIKESRLEEIPGEDLRKTVERFIWDTNTMIDKDLAIKLLDEVMD